MFGLFDPPQLKLHRQAARDARASREFAGRKASAELLMLAKQISVSSDQRDTAYHDGRLEQAGALTVALGPGQELLNRMGYSVDALVDETEEQWRSANTIARFEALTVYEHDLRSMLVSLREEARLHLGAIALAGSRQQG